MAESLHSGLLAFVPLVHQLRQVARLLARPGEPLWPLGWDFELMSSISGGLNIFSVALLCSWALGEVSQLFIIVGLIF